MNIQPITVHSETIEKRHWDALPELCGFWKLKLGEKNITTSKNRETLKLAASKNELCVCGGKKRGKTKKKIKKKTFLFLVRTKEATSLTFSICNFNRVDDTKDTKDFFLCAVCILLVLFYSFHLSLWHTVMYSCNSDTPKKFL